MTWTVPLEQVCSGTALGLAVHDLLTDTRVADGLLVQARPARGGRTTPAFTTRSGAYAFRGLDGMRSVELPGPGDAGPPLVPRDFDVSIVDLKGRFVAAVLRVPVPTQGLVTHHVLGLPGGSTPTEDLPIYLFSAPTRALPAHLAAVRADLVDGEGEPAAFARLTVLLDPDGPAERRHSGVADAAGAVVVAFPFPRFTGVAGPPGSLPSAGTHGQPTAARTWPARVLVHHDPAVLLHPADLPAPTLDTVLAQRPGRLQATTTGPALEFLDVTVPYGSELVLRTSGDPRSRLLVAAP
jgi:hypothetical protein